MDAERTHGKGEFVTLAPERIEALAQAIVVGRNSFRSNTFASKQNRDAVFRRVKELAPNVNWNRRSIRNQLLHPQYVADAEEYLRAQTGFGNTVYRTAWAALYSVRRDGGF